HLEQDAVLLLAREVRELLAYVRQSDALVGREPRQVSPDALGRVLGVRLRWRGGGLRLGGGLLRGLAGFGLGARRGRRRLGRGRLASGQDVDALLVDESPTGGGGGIASRRWGSGPG